MNAKPLSQEGLKFIACVTMLLDHMGAVLFPHSLWLRLIGRMAFPIYCFLLAEGAQHTKDPGKYALRLLIGAVLSEIPFDLALHRSISFADQNVFFTLLLALLALMAMNDVSLWVKPLIAIPFALAAHWLHTDYGAMGVIMAVMFAMTRELEEKQLLQTVGILALGFLVFTTNFLQPLAVMAMVPISLYSGKKGSHSKSLQWGFYLFYPAHLLVLWLISVLI